MISIDWNKNHTILLDTAPIIYLVENHATYFPIIQTFFKQAEKENVVFVTTPITLAECLYYPYKQDNKHLQEQFLHLLTRGHNVRFVPVTADISQNSAKLRANYNLGFADALQVATALSAGCTTLLTNDKGWKRVKELSTLLLDDYL